MPDSFSNPIPRVAVNDPLELVIRGRTFRGVIDELVYDGAGSATVTLKGAAEVFDSTFQAAPAPLEEPPPAGPIDWLAVFCDGLYRLHGPRRADGYLALTELEYNLLAALCAAPGKLIKNYDLALAIYSSPKYGDEAKNAPASFWEERRRVVRQLRGKLRMCGWSADVVYNRYNVGYGLDTALAEDVMRKAGVWDSAPRKTHA